MPTYLLDTNVVLRLLDRNDAAHNQCRLAVERLILRGDEPCLAPQVLTEFWVVATRPAHSNGFGWDVATARNAVEELGSRFLLLPESRELFDEWFRLVTTYSISGKRAHDARLAAFVSVHSLDAVLTLNPVDFSGLGIHVVQPASLVAREQ
ncbi:type II toxin-antitoxin system VapC family toxin [Candidatus Thiosymbion oneisti]|uniref:type II toxin-antitoxin system VapC family toxin n=1 Tax=Candidatus Thiosymbion oneisti TaxID=589554 RepID=UPI000B7C5BD3|nr:PIN domain-containing protein [Candidatus Thiosymbion oneisti]